MKMIYVVALEVDLKENTDGFPSRNELLAHVRNELGHSTKRDEGIGWAVTDVRSLTSVIGDAIV